MNPTEPQALPGLGLGLYCAEEAAMAELVDPVDEDDDTAAEPDTTEPDTAEEEGEPEPPPADDAVETGVCAGGPWHGRIAASRFALGFLLVDRPGARVWLYDWNGRAYVLRAGSPEPLDEDRRWLAAEGSDFDVLAYDDAPVPT